MNINVSTNNDIRQAVILLSLRPASLMHRNFQRHKRNIIHGMRASRRTQRLRLIVLNLCFCRNILFTSVNSVEVIMAVV